MMKETANESLSENLIFACHPIKLSHADGIFGTVFLRDYQIKRLLSSDRIGCINQVIQ